MRLKHSFNPKTITASLLFLLFSLPAHAETVQDYVARAEKAFEESDIVSTMAWYRKAAEAGYIPAQKRLAYLLDKSEQNEEAVEWYRKAAAQGDAEAEHGLARMYVTGEGITQDNKAALRLFTSSADKGYAPAIHVMAAACEKGELGLRVDYECARAWLAKGVILSDYWSVNRLARAYANGELGLRIDRQKAAQLEKQLTQISRDGN